MKFIHSSDLQIGKAFGYFDPEVAGSLQDARQAVVRTLGEPISFLMRIYASPPFDVTDSARISMC
jgi:hypothetical protein